MLAYKFTEKYSQAVHELLRTDVGYISGGQIASILYDFYVKGLSVKEMNCKTIEDSLLATYVLQGGAYEGNKQLFLYVLERFPEQLDELFDVKQQRKEAIINECRH